MNQRRNQNRGAIQCLRDWGTVNQVFPLTVALLTILIWGVTASANKLAAAEVDAFSVALYRSALAGSISLVIALALRLRRPKTMKDLLLLLLSGSTSFFAWPIIFSIGVSLTSVSHTAVIMATIPILTVLIHATKEKAMPGHAWFLASMIAFAATAILVTQATGSTQAEPAAASAIGDLVLLFGSAICAAGYVSGGLLTRRIGAIATTFWGMAVSLALCLPIVIFWRPEIGYAELTQVFWLSFGWLVFVASILGYIMWYYALGAGGIQRIASIQLLLPVATLVIGILFLTEPVSPLLIGLCLVISFSTYRAQKTAT